MLKKKKNYKKRQNFFSGWTENILEYFVGMFRKPSNICQVD